jgi:DNA-binding transcriptional regulator PaaX
MSRANLKKIILSTVAVAGAVGIAAVAPQALGAMAQLGLVPAKRQKEFINNSRSRLVHKGLLAYSDGLLRLTPRGEKVLQALEVRDFQLKKPKRWDGKWRVLIFDIPERRKGTREQVRRTLLRIGFTRLQDSVWVYPYDCEDLITFLKADFHIGKDVLYMVVDALENDQSLKRHFSLIR